MVRNWFWEIEANQTGPDYLFFADFNPNQAQRLAELVRQHPLPGFKYYRAIDRLCELHHHKATYDLYIDEYCYESIVAQIEGKKVGNVWIYDLITVCGADLKIQRGYGGGSLGGDVETDLIVKLLQAEDLAIAKWEIIYGGVGYDYKDMATGTSAVELLDYLLDRG
ncbi:MAG: hypothetical protein KME17_19970 [Cyanosarcina radialis HA8281-LM2]|jgi:hypothetical protein|nr:hypothetical protein [Cyanosarcina radialis HA8281-LM2]